LHIIDVNCFFGCHPYAGPQFTKVTQLENLRQSGIERIFLTSTKALAYDVEIGNREIINFTQQYDYLSPVGVFPLDIGHISDIQSFIDTPMQIYRLQVTDDITIDPKDRTLRQFLTNFSNRGCGILVEYRLDTHTLIDQIAEEYPNLSFILTGINYPQFRVSFGLFERHDNIYLETSYFQLYEGIEYLVNLLGAERLVFGTNSPFYAHQSAILKLQKADISMQDRELIASGNIRRILKERRS